MEKITYDGLVRLSVGASRKAKVWENVEMKWSEFLMRLGQPQVTQETLAEYQEMPKSAQDAVKDVGGFVGGWLKDGRRKRGDLLERHLLTLDVDNATEDFWGDVQLLNEHAAAIYTTHSHGVKGPRYRLIFPLKRAVTAEEYEPLARKAAAMFGMDCFDDTTYQAERLMYWPSCSADGCYFTEYLDLPWLDPDEVLAAYDDWRDRTSWPESSRGLGVRALEAEQAEDPLLKRGIVGAFCRLYNVDSAIEAFLPEVYERTSCPERWTYLAGTTSGGLVVYEGKWAYSHHGTDPVSGRLVNAFDLVRLHRFGALDAEQKPDTPGVLTKSFVAMQELLLADEAVVSEVKKNELERR